MWKIFLEQAAVLLSGGMDSTAALHWALAHAADVRAIAFDYGQPHRDAELYAAQALCDRRGVPFTRVALADAFLTTTRTGLLASVPRHDETSEGAHPAYIPARNLVFLSVAAAHALSWWPKGPVSLVMGACADDRAGFPDCRWDAFVAMSDALSEGCDRKVEVHAPFAYFPKTQILELAERWPNAIQDIRFSWSCYRGVGPCGECTPCVLRRQAFEEHGLVDQCLPPTLRGGDPAREARR